MAIQLAHLSITMPVLLAPMAGITDLPFRRCVASFGAGLVVSEMVASGEMLSGGREACARAFAGIEAEGAAVQLAGREAAPMAEAARMLTDAGARIIDINMGCPAKKVTGGLSGAALMRRPDHALRLIEAVVGAAGTVPVTLKMRLGWDSTAHTAPALAARAEAAGVQMITVHGRTRCQFYKGRADWAAIAPVVQAVSVPVVANGDITDTPSARAALAASGAAGVMVGRGAQGRPWALARIGAGLAGAPAPKAPEGAARAALVATHYEAMLAHYGRDLGVRVARKHLGWYMEAAATPGPLRREILTTSDPACVLARLPAAFEMDPRHGRQAA